MRIVPDGQLDLAGDGFSLQVGGDLQGHVDPGRNAAGGIVFPIHRHPPIGGRGPEPGEKVTGLPMSSGTANEEGADPPYAIQLVGLFGGTVATTSSFGVTVEACPAGPIGTFVIPGGSGVHEARKDAGCLAFLAEVAGRPTRICSICTGAFLITAARLLDGRRATGGDALALAYPSVLVEERPLFIEDGPIWTLPASPPGSTWLLR
ncbi:DJ-1/PfpI family protein [Teichococcus vastitatis]|uniref:DJ-1/PfpI family protein n=1 Tax=Teichococcus vastitatis TaxID=2307076 RepID=A0ABS9WD11_9PROT|nr:DJ-1/PfpI family protein [Pseudoroseomonas vastitatis]MCI0757112.1 DJ-1/PfpI family protein [Pseudoroseomonas vastitatis]